MTLFSWIVIVACAVTCARALAAMTSEQKLDYFKAEARASENNIVHLSKAFFINNIMKGPRPYNVAVLFTALKPQFKCGACSRINEEFKYVGTSVHTASLKADVPTFVVEMDFSHGDSEALFAMLGLSNVPLLAFIKADDFTTTQPNSFLNDIPKSHKFDFNTHGFAAEAIVKWINGVSGLDATLARPIDWSALFSNILLPAIIGSIPLYFIGPVIWAKRGNTKIYLVLSLGIYLFCVSGGMYNILKDTPWAHHDHNGVSYLHGDSGWQLGAESYICGSVQVLFGLLITILGTTAVQIDSKSTRNLMSGGALLLCFYLWFKIRWLVSYKMGGYNNGWVYQWL
uniref:Magnesium transporter protein 1 n=1 Tax=Spongospora subterranea TaxID=70186 RepID=A0A0H5R7G4_9EUKA|eukprot:CRZ10090.1 hypothetical protein [Spongospora subterranea]